MKDWTCCASPSRKYSRSRTSLRRLRALAGASALLCMALAASAERRPVLDQIAVPHDYYYREMYLPQLSSGPSGVAFTPDGRSLVYSMQGSLWIQPLDSGTATQLTAGPGYDYQPDVAPDGKRVVFVRYLADALELNVLDLESGTVQQITSGGAVNCEPRWSPDGKRIAWVSTTGTGHFHVFVGDLNDGKLVGGAAWPERKSHTARYYYSAYDHELSPSWSPDGRELIYVGNPEIIYGTGSIWRRALTAGAEPRLIRQEETTWRARPDWSPDGKRIVYASYTGRNGHQIWSTTSAGNGDPLALTYGAGEASGARWSADGRRVAYLSNRSGDNQIQVMDLPGAKTRTIAVRERHYLKPMGRLQLHVTGVAAHGPPVSARIAVVAADGRAYAPDDAWMHAEDGYDRKLAPFETHYFHSQGDSTLSLPPGLAKITVYRGLATQIARSEILVRAGETVAVNVALTPLALPPAWQTSWHSADVHVHMNYAGAYRNTPEHLVRQADAEDLDVVFDLVVNKEQRIPDYDYFSPVPDAASTPSVLISHGQEFHTSYWGHLGLLGLNDHFLLPGYAAYANTAAASLYPTNAAVADLAHAQSALVGYVHPYDHVPDPAHDATLTSELPVDVALGKVDYYEVVGFSDNHRATAEVWHRLLSCGFRVAAAGGTDAMANFASLHGPVGLYRVYVQDGAHATSNYGAPELKSRLANWLQALKAGHSLATNSALLGLEVEGKGPGSEVALTPGHTSVHVKGFMRSIVPIDHLELIQQGKGAKAIPLSGDRRSADIDMSVPVSGPGWLLLRAWNDHADPDIFDIYPYATTSPVFLTRQGSEPHCGKDADYFISWIDRLASAAQNHPDYNTAAERDLTLAQIAAARKVFEARR
jgi:TolB protein